MDERFFLFSDIDQKEEVKIKKDEYAAPPKNFIKLNKKAIEDI